MLKGLAKCYYEEAKYTCSGIKKDMVKMLEDKTPSNEFESVAIVEAIGYIFGDLTFQDQLELSIRNVSDRICTAML